MITKGEVFDGVFKNNYFYHGGSLSFSPFQPMKDITEFLKNQKSIQISKENRKRDEKKVIDIVAHKENILNKLQLSYDAKMTPFVLSSMKAYIDLKEVVEIIRGNVKNVFVFDVKKANDEISSGPAHLSNLTTRSPSSSLYMSKVKHALAGILADGGVFIISLDSDLENKPTPAESQALPALTTLYSPNYFPSQILHPEDLANPSVFKKVLQSTKHEDKTEISKDAIVMLWGKMKIEATQQTDVMYDKIKRTYEKKSGHAEGVEMTPLNIYVIDGN